MDLGTHCPYPVCILNLTESQSKSGGLLAVASDKGYVSLFDSESGALVTAFPGKLPERSSRHCLQRES